MEQVFTVGEIARLLGVLPRKVSDVFYQGKVPSDRTQIAGGRRLIPISLLPAIREALGIEGSGV